jgi:hypothetical protein
VESPTIFWFAVVAVVAAGVAIAWFAYAAKAKRREGLLALAVREGLEFSVDDPLGLLWYPFHLFTRGDGRGVENVLHGTWNDIPLAAFDFWFYDETTDSKGGRHRTYHRFSCALGEVEAALGSLVIGRESVFSRFADAVGFDDIAFESDAFNRTFEVRCEDRRFASAFVDPRMMEWLLATDRRQSFATGGRWLLVVAPRQPVEGFPGLLTTLRDFRAQVPRVIPSLFPLDPPGATPGVGAEG